MKRPRIRRLFQFSLRTMLVVVVVLSVALGVLGVKARKARHQRAVMKWVNETGGDVEAKRHGLFVRVKLRLTQVTDLSPLAKLTEIRLLDLSDTQVTDLAPLANLANLERLTLLNTPVTAEEVAKLQKALPNCVITHDLAG